MKIEKINDNQIRCTLTREDLEDRDITISELAYGSMKIKELFQDMMRQANDDFGFDVSNIPLMVEATPIPSDGIVLVITKVPNQDEDGHHYPSLFSNGFPEELKEKIKESLYAHFGDAGVELDDFDEIIEDSLDDYDDETPLDEESSLDKDNNQPKLEEYSVHLLSSYDDLNVLIDLAGILNDEFSGESSLYKSPLDGRYYLNVLFTSKDEFFVARARGLISEYGRTEDVTAFKPAYLNEHYEVIIADHAVEKLASIAY